MNNNPSSPNSLFNSAKDWIDQQQAKTLELHNNRAQSGVSPLSELLVDIKENPKKYTQFLKKTVLGLAVLMTSSGSFNPDALGQSQPKNQGSSQIKTEINQSTTETKLAREFVNKVFQDGGEYSSMQRGGTPKAIKHALENAGAITNQNAPQYIMEAIKTNNGTNNPVNLELYKTQYKIYMENIKSGYTPTEALIRSAQEAAQNNPAQIKASQTDLQRLQTVAVKIRGEQINITVDKTVGLSDTTKTKIKAELQKSINLSPNIQNQLYKKLLAQNQTPLVAPTIGKNDANNQKNTVLNANNKETSEFDRFMLEHQKTIEDLLKKSGILATGVVVSAAGIAITQKLFKKYQTFQRIKPEATNQEIRQNFSNYISRLKADQIKQKNFESKLKAHIIKRQLVNNSQSPTEATGTAIEASQGTSVKAQLWSFLVNKLNPVNTNLTNYLKDKANKSTEILQSINTDSRTSIEDFVRLQKTRIREAGVIKDINKTQKSTKSESTNPKKLKSQDDSLTQNQIPPSATVDEAQPSSQIEHLDEIKKRELRAKMDNFEIPFVPEVNDTHQPESIVIPEDMREYTNFDIQAALILSEDNIEITLNNSRYARIAQKAADFINNNIPLESRATIWGEIADQYSLPQLYRITEITWDRGPSRYGIGKKMAKINKYNYFLKKYIEGIDVYAGGYANSYIDYLKFLGGLKEHFVDNHRMQNALDVLIELVKERDVVYQLRNKMKLELVRRNGTPGIHNVDGKCEELRGPFHLNVKVFAEVHFNKSYYWPDSEFPVDDRGFGDSSNRLLNSLTGIMIEKNPATGKTELRDMDKLDVNQIELILNDLKALVQAYGIPYGDVESNKPETKNIFNMRLLDSLLLTCNDIKTRLKKPANQLEFEVDEYEFDIIPEGADNKHMALEQFIFDKSYPRQPIPNPLRVEIINGQSGIKYPTSKMFPNVLENEAERKHFVRLMDKLENHPDRFDFEAALRALRNPTNCSESDRQFLENITSILSKPYFAYRPYRNIDPSNPKQLDLEMLLLGGYGTTEE